MADWEGFQVEFRVRGLKLAVQEFRSGITATACDGRRPYNARAGGLSGAAIILSTVVFGH